jgi:hypothetical protein
MIVCISAISCPLWANEEWKCIKDTDDVRTYARSVEGSDFKELKAVMFVDVSFEVAVEIAKDHDHYRDWYGMCEDLYVIEKRNDHDYDMYFVLDMPAGSDRDLVINITTDWDYEKGLCQVAIKGKDSPYKMDSGLVRMPKMDGRFTITRVNPNRIKAIYQFFADTGGSIPPWIVNQGAWRHPYETMAGLLKEVGKSKYTQRANRLHNANLSPMLD